MQADKGAPPPQERTTVEPEWARRALERKEQEAAAARADAEVAANAGTPAVGQPKRPAPRAMPSPGLMNRGIRACARLPRRHPWLAGCAVVAAGAIGFWSGGEPPVPSAEPSRLPAMADVTEYAAGDGESDVPPPVRTAAAFINSDLQGQSPDERGDGGVRTVPFIMYDAPLKHPVIQQVEHEAPRPANGQAAWLTGKIESGVSTGTGESPLTTRSSHSTPDDYPLRRTGR